MVENMKEFNFLNTYLIFASFLNIAFLFADGIKGYLNSLYNFIIGYVNLIVFLATIFSPNEPTNYNFLKDGIYLMASLFSVQLTALILTILLWYLNNRRN